MLDTRSLALATLLSTVLVPLPAAAAAVAGVSDPHHSAPVARVGGHRIDERDLELRQRVLDVTYPSSSSPAAALAQLVESLLATELLARQGHGSATRELEAEALRIDRETRMPEMLARIQAIFGDDRDRYLTVFVRTDTAAARLWEKHQRDPEPEVAERGFGPWFWSEAGKVPVEIFDQDLLTELRLEVAWGENLRLAAADPTRRLRRSP